jgi:hypothetical protein
MLIDHIDRCGQPPIGWALLASAFCGAEASAACRLLPNGLAHQRFCLFLLKK